MTYEEMKLLRPGTLFRVKGGVYDYMFLQGASPFDHMIRVEMIRAKSAVLLCTTRL
jgi:hypothetical protein